MPDILDPDTAAAEAQAAAAAERANLREQIRMREAAATSYDRMAGDHDSSAFRMRQVAAGLTAEINPLRTVFTAIRGLHTPNTWEGQAAAASRVRLDGHEARTNSAILLVDRLVEDLQDEAVIQEGLGDQLRGEASSLRSGNWSLQEQINALY